MLTKLSSFMFILSGSSRKGTRRRDDNVGYCMGSIGGFFI